jgi:predicted transcriptional regulator
MQNIIESKQITLTQIEEKTGIPYHKIHYLFNRSASHDNVLKTMNSLFDYLAPNIAEYILQHSEPHGKNFTMADQIDFRRIIRTEMKRQGLSVSQLSEQTGISLSMLYGFLRRAHGVSPESLEKLFEILNLAVAPHGMQWHTEARSRKK